MLDNICQINFTIKSIDIFIVQVSLKLPVFGAFFVIKATQREIKTGGYSFLHETVLILSSSILKCKGYTIMHVFIFHSLGSIWSLIVRMLEAIFVISVKFVNEFFLQVVMLVVF
jgi:hypothetical protein